MRSTIRVAEVCVMVRLRLLELRLKMKSRAWLEAMWKGRWCGIVLTGAATITCAFLFYFVPPPGVSVAVMGVTAAIMTARIKPTGPEKAAWMLIISALLVIEVSAIKEERFFNGRTETIR